MLYSFNDVCRCRVRASDGALGAVRDLEIDEETWTIARVGVRLDGPGARRDECRDDAEELLYVPTSALADPDWIQDEVLAGATRAELERLADERTGWIPAAAAGAKQRALVAGSSCSAAPVIERTVAGHVGARELVGLRFEASDGRLGRVLDVLFESEGWAVRWLQVGPCPFADNLLVPPFALAALGSEPASARATLSRRELAECKRLEIVEGVGSQRARLLAIRSAPLARRGAG